MDTDNIIAKRFNEMGFPCDEDTWGAALRFVTGETVLLTRELVGGRVVIQENHELDSARAALAELMRPSVQDFRP